MYHGPAARTLRTPNEQRSRLPPRKSRAAKNRVKRRVAPLAYCAVTTCRIVKDGLTLWRTRNPREGLWSSACER